eukprot:4745621-Pleurochrysis_carterae.AAC.3
MGRCWIESKRRDLLCQAGRRLATVLWTLKLERHRRCAWLCKAVASGCLRPSEPPPPSLHAHSAAPTLA